MLGIYLHSLVKTMVKMTEDYGRYDKINTIPKNLLLRLLKTMKIIIGIDDGCFATFVRLKDMSYFHAKNHTSLVCSFPIVEISF
jgi:hypothetical protein